MNACCYGLNAGPLDFYAKNCTAMETGSHRQQPAVLLLPDGGVHFSTYSPDSLNVEIAFRKSYGTARYPLIMDEDGYWGLTLYDIPGGLHDMYWYYDGILEINRNAPIRYAFGGASNFIDLPHDESDFYALKAVPHGAVRQEYFFSRFTKQYRTCWVYTPPSYDVSAERNYPVLYALNDGSEGENAWIWAGKINLILDNLIAERKCEEMVVVVNSGYVFTKEGRRENALLENVAQMLQIDLIPFIEKRFRVYADKPHRAIVGTSLGALQAQWTAFRYSDLFDYIGIFSSRMPNEFVWQSGQYDLSRVFLTENTDRFNQQHKLLFYARGLNDTCAYQQEDLETLRKQNITVQLFTCQGGHTWNFWRKAELAFLPQLFR